MYQNKNEMVNIYVQLDGWVRKGKKLLHGSEFRIENGKCRQCTHLGGIFMVSALNATNLKSVRLDYPSLIISTLAVAVQP